VKSFVNLWKYLADFFLEWEMFLTQYADKFKTHTTCSINSFRKSCLLWRRVEKYGRSGQATCDSVFSCYWCQKDERYEGRKFFEKVLPFSSALPPEKCLPFFNYFHFLTSLVLFRMTHAFKILCKGLTLTNPVRLWFVNPSWIYREY
jgi:hypothetical protein